jgi:hypothetical protein
MSPLHSRPARALGCCVLTTLALAQGAVAQSGETSSDVAAMMAAAAAANGESKGKEKKPDFPKWSEVSEGYSKVNSSADGSKGLYGIWTRSKDAQMLAELPAGFEGQNHYIALTVPTGELFSGLQAGDMYVKWKRYDKRLALIAPNLDVRSTGDQESKDSIKNHFVDEVLLDVPIVCMGPSGQPVIDMDDLLIGKASKFYGPYAGGMNKSLATIEKAKAFPQNVELAYTVPTSGQMKTYHYSISKIPDANGYKPREADDRIGYFMTTWRDLGKFRDDQVRSRYINRWRLEKADPKLKMSPAKEPITFYIEHTVPIRYRRWVKEGVLMWNEAFEQIGISDAVVVHYQDKATGAHMDKDPEDVRYNFLRWLSNDIGTAIGPSRAHPLTGQILDADIVLTDGWIRHFWYQKNEFMPQTAMSGFSESDLAWFAQNPEWDPRVLMSAPEDRAGVVAQLAEQRALAVASGLTSTTLASSAAGAPADMHRLAGQLGPDASLCMAAEGKAREMAMVGLQFALAGTLDGGSDKDDDNGRKDTDEEGDDEDDEVLIDGIPESFIGPMLADLVAHECGHTLGLRHNFKASSQYTMAEMNSEALKGKVPFAGSVMDYIPVNLNMDDGEVQGDWAMIGVGPYDMWAIEFGYTFDDPKKVATRCAEPELAYSTDFDTSGPDPLARRYDFSKDPLEYCESRMRLARHQRERILDEFVKDGDSWGRARRGYAITLGGQTGSISMMANWVGGTFVNKDHKGDEGARKPLEPVAADVQRKALKFVVDNAFQDEAFGLTPELMQHMTMEKWSDPDDWMSAYDDATYPVHDQIMGVQGSALSMLLSPSTLRRVYDNELMIPADQDALTVAEVMETISGSIWNELAARGGSYTNRAPMISSLRRNLQGEHIERLIDLSMGAAWGAVEKPVSNLAVAKLRELNEGIGQALRKSGVDDYSRAHLSEAQIRITKALDAQYVYNADAMGGGGGSVFYFGKDAGQR